MTTTSENSKAVLLPPGQNYYPSAPSIIKLGLWNRQSASWSGIAPWLPNDRYFAKFEWLSVQCYDNLDRPVEVWGEAPVVTTTTTTTTAVLALPTAEPTVKKTTGTTGGANALGGRGVGAVAALVGVVASVLLF